MRILQARILEWSCNFLLQDIFPIQGSNPGLPHCKQILYHLSYQGKPMELERVRHNLATEQQQPGWEPHFPQKNSKILVYTCIFWGSTGPCQSLRYHLFVDGCSFVSVFFPFPDKQLLESTIWNSGKFKEGEAFLLQTRNRGHGKNLYPGRPHRVLHHLFLQHFGTFLSHFLSVRICRVWILAILWETTHLVIYVCLQPIYSLLWWGRKECQWFVKLTWFTRLSFPTGWLFLELGR